MRVTLIWLIIELRNCSPEGNSSPQYNCQKVIFVSNWKPHTYSFSNLIKQIVHQKKIGGLDSKIKITIRFYLYLSSVQVWGLLSWKLFKGFVSIRVLYFIASLYIWHHFFHSRIDFVLSYHCPLTSASSTVSL